MTRLPAIDLATVTKRDEVKLVFRQIEFVDDTVIPHSQAKLFSELRGKTGWRQSGRIWMAPASARKSPLSNLTSLGNLPINKRVKRVFFLLAQTGFFSLDLDEVSAELAKLARQRGELPINKIIPKQSHRINYFLRKILLRYIFQGCFGDQAAN